MAPLPELRRAASEIFFAALKSVDPRAAVRRALSFEDSCLRVGETIFSAEELRNGIYAVAIGKAARPMASVLDEVLGERLTAGVITAPPSDDSLNECWRVFAGGHPLPNGESMLAARAAFKLLGRADETRAPVIFLISGGGSAMMEWPRDPEITLDELRAANGALVSCGAGITEINAVRRAVSAVKGGRLAERAAHSRQVSLIISDTGHGEEASVASGPTFDPPAGAPDAASVIARYGLASILPDSILRSIKHEEKAAGANAQRTSREHYVLLENETALEAAADAAQARGYAVEIARDITEQPIAEGCSLLLSRLFRLRYSMGKDVGVASLISGGEFACPVRGRGVGGRNTESALRWAIELEKYSADDAGQHHTVTLSAGTDSIDGNSPAAGAIADETTVERARRTRMKARDFLDESDAYTFFERLGETLVTGATGTNVRDVRILLAS